MPTTILFMHPHLPDEPQGLGLTVFVLSLFALFAVLVGTQTVISLREILHRKQAGRQDATTPRPHHLIGDW